MPVTKPQADMLATLATACRPTGAPRWDAPGVVAAIGKVKHLSLADVARAVINAADDRDAQTPGVIANLRSACWQDRPMRPAPIQVLSPAERCGVTGKAIDACRSAPRFGLGDNADDHVCTPDFKQPAGSAVGELRDIKANATAAAGTEDDEREASA